MKSKAWVLVAALAALGVGGCKSSGVSLDGMVSAGQNLATAATLTDEDVKAIGDRTTAELDKQNKVAGNANKYAKRLAKLSGGWKSVDGKALEYKVYLTADINAFAVPNGSIRVFSGLMDEMNDDELRYVIAHEIGHVVLGHSKKAIQTAYTATAVREATAASGNSAASALSSSQLGALGEALVNAQFSQKQENEADDFAVNFLKQKGLKTGGAVTALRKIQAKSGGDSSSLFASHPAAGKRAERMEKLIAGK